MEDDEDDPDEEEEVEIGEELDEEDEDDEEEEQEMPEFVEREAAAVRMLQQQRQKPRLEAIVARTAAAKQNARRGKIHSCDAQRRREEGLLG